MIASTRDGGREAVADGEFGVLVDPTESAELTRALLAPQEAPPPEAVRERFGPAAYRRRVGQVLREIG